jgi:hypothetical protein
MINLHHFPLPWELSRRMFDTEAEYLYALEHYDELYNEAEDLAMDKYYEEKDKS